jgi:uncharacterized membrane protein HdeD (DUF308 family)
VSGRRKGRAGPIVVMVVGCVFLLVGGVVLINAAAGVETGMAGSGVVYLIVGALSLLWASRMRRRRQVEEQ